MANSAKIRANILAIVLVSLANEASVIVNKGKIVMHMQEQETPLCIHLRARLRFLARLLLLVVISVFRYYVGMGEMRVSRVRGWIQ